MGSSPLLCPNCALPIIRTMSRFWVHYSRATLYIAVQYGASTSPLLHWLPSVAHYTFTTIAAAPSVSAAAAVPELRLGGVGAPPFSSPANPGSRRCLLRSKNDLETRFAPVHSASSPTKFGDAPSSSSSCSVCTHNPCGMPTRIELECPLPGVAAAPRRRRY